MFSITTIIALSEHLPSNRGSVPCPATATLPFLTRKAHPKLHLSSNRNLDLDTGLNIDNDLLHNLGRRIKTAIPLSLASPQK